MAIHHHIRHPAVAGSFYPDNAQELDLSLQTFLGNAFDNVIPIKPKAMIVPHAGYIYSGSTAAKAYAQLSPFARQISKVILLGPSHKVPILGVASSACDQFKTPLGDVPIDKAIINKLNEQFPFVNINDEAHQHEHSLEVQLPFLQKVLPQFTLVPLVIGQAEDEQISALIESLWQEPGTLFLISSDLSHYLDYDRAKQCDLATSQAILDLTPEKIHYEQACGRSAIAGMLIAAKKYQLSVQMLGLCNSGDTAGDKSRVVGYGAWTFF